MCQVCIFSLCTDFLHCIECFPCWLGLFRFMQSHCLLLCFFDFGAIQNSLPRPVSGSFSSIFIWKLIVSDPVFKSLVCPELVFGYGCFILFHLDVWFSQHHLLKRLVSLLFNLRVFVKDQVTMCGVGEAQGGVGCMVSPQGVSSVPLVSVLCFYPSIMLS